MGVPRLSRWATVAGAAVGTAVTAALVVAGPLRLPAPVDRGDAAPAFLEAWARSRAGTFVVRSRYERRQPAGGVLSTTSELVQRPPDRLVRRFGGVTGVVDGYEVSCTGDAGEPACVRAAEPAPPYDERVRRELDAFTDWFAPPEPNTRPRYRVIRASTPGCFDLVLTVPGAEAPYGTDARLCFDGATGAPASVERRFENGVIESEQAEEIVPHVSAADLALPDVPLIVAGEGGGAGGEGGGPAGEPEPAPGSGTGG